MTSCAISRPTASMRSSAPGNLIAIFWWTRSTARPGAGHQDNGRGGRGLLSGCADLGPACGCSFRSCESGEGNPARHPVQRIERSDSVECRQARGAVPCGQHCADGSGYKPRMQAFEFMLDQLGCAPEHILHVSSSYRYDLMTAHDMRFGMPAFVNRGHEPLTPYSGAHEIADIGGLPGLVGLRVREAALRGGGQGEEHEADERIPSGSTRPRPSPETRPLQARGEPMSRSSGAASPDFPRRSRWQGRAFPFAFWKRARLPRKPRVATAATATTASATSSRALPRASAWNGRARCTAPSMPASISSKAL